MSLAENLLNSLDATSYKNMRTAGSVEEEHIIVGKDRVITVPNALKTIAVKGDKDVETATIDCIRYWDENDLSTFAIYLNYILPNGDEGTYIPKTITKSDDFFSFDWEIGSEFTYAQGKLTFWIVTKLTDDNGELVKQWSSFQNSDCSIAQGGDKIYVPEKQTDQDVISQAISISRASAETAEKQAILAIEAANKAALDASQAAEEEVSRIIGELGVVQELGDSPNSVVSQLKVTKEFNKTNAKINRNSKRITNLEQGLPAEMFETDSTMAYQKDVPENVLPYASINKIGGMTYKCTVAEGEDGYFTGLRSAKVTEVKSVGVNLFDIDKREFGTIDSNGDLYLANQLFDFYRFEAKENTQYTLSAYVKNMNATGNGRFAVLYTDGLWDNVVLLNSGTDWAYCSFTTAAGKTVEKILNYHGDLGAWFIKGGELMINEGSTALPYTPYVEHILPIPEELRPANGINAEVYDSIELNENGSVTKRVKCVGVDLGTLDWKFLSNDVYYCVDYQDEIKPPYVKCDNYVQTKTTSISNMLDKEILVDSIGAVYIKDSSLTAASDITGSAVFKLAEPEVTDNYADLIIDVEGGGTLTFENEYGYAVPSEVEYQVEV